MEPQTSGPVRHKGRNFWTAFGLALSLCGGSPVQAAASASESQTFAIPAQPLSNALSQFARQTGIALLHPRIPPEVNSPGVRGHMDAPEALRRLVEGTPFELAGEHGGPRRSLALRHRRPGPENRGSEGRGA